MSNATKSLPNEVEIENPRDSGGIIKQTSLTGRSFLSRCPIPDIKPYTKILAVCGINDYNEANNPDKPGMAAPDQDGWFFSDFYFLHHLFKDIATDQIWMTCVRPKDAVRKYTQYVQGDWRVPGDRRIVLNQAMLPEVEDVRFVPPKDLATSFLATLREICIEAIERPRPILIVVCTHGEARGYSWQMGGTGRPSNWPRVTMETFKQALGTRSFAASLCLLTTSCFGGGWAINPELNITSMSAQNYWKQSLAWPMSGTANRRYCGSPFASAIAKTLLSLTVDGFEGDQVDDFNEAPTYAGFITLVTEMVERLDPRGEGIQGSADYVSVHNPTFSAQDDAWEMAYSTRTGFPLNMFQQRWLQLRAAGYSSPPPGGEHRFGPGERVFSYDVLKTVTKKEVKEYLKSYPGDDSLSKNTSLHGRIYALLSEKRDFMPIELECIREEVDYRMNQVMAAATVYKNYLGIEFDDCHEVDVWTCSRTDLSVKWLGFVNRYPLFDESAGLQGHSYGKGELYIAACLTKAGWDDAVAESKLDELVKYKSMLPV
jgi:hypothetical protein